MRASSFAKPLYAAIDIARLLSLSELSLKQRLELFNVALRAWTRTASIDYALHLPGAGEIYFGRKSLNADWNVFSEVFLDRCYGDQYSGATVLDIGAHKGYFGAFALLQGAARVVSLEPERHNFSFLKRTAEVFCTHGHRWDAHKAAVGVQRTTAQLNVSGEAWTHSLLPLPATGSRRKVHEEEVDVVPLEILIEEEASRSSRLVVKLDIEGAECDVVFGTTLETWSATDDVFIETHTFAPCAPRQIADHLAQAKLFSQGDTSPQIAHFRRERRAF